MCDYSLYHVKSRPAAVGDKLTTYNFGVGTRGFASVDGEKDTAVCVLPGTELAFDKPIEAYGEDKITDTVARFRQINKENAYTHHDALELPDGKLVMLTFLHEGQTATVLQLPAAPKTEAEVEEQRRVEVVG